MEGPKQKTARKSTGGILVNRKLFPTQPTSSGIARGADSDEEMKSSPTEQLAPPASTNNVNNFTANNSKSKSGYPSIKPSPDVTPTELQIRQLELMEEQCDSLEKLVEIAAERRDIEREILEIKKRKLAIMEKNLKK